MPRHPVVSRKMTVTECILVGIDKYTHSEVEITVLFPRVYKDSEAILNKARKRFGTKGLAVAYVKDYRVLRITAHMDEEDYVQHCTVDSSEVVTDFKHTSSLNKAQ